MIKILQQNLIEIMMYIWVKLEKLTENQCYSNDTIYIQFIWLIFFFSASNVMSIYQTRPIQTKNIDTLQGELMEKGFDNDLRNINPFDSVVKEG